MRALVLTGDKRSHTMPDVPTLKELGIDVVRTPGGASSRPPARRKPIIDKLVAELSKAISCRTSTRCCTETHGMDVVALGPEATQKLIADNMARWGKVVQGQQHPR